MKNSYFINSLLLFILVSSGNTLQAGNKLEEAKQTEARVSKVTKNVYGIMMSGFNSLVVIGADGVAITDPAFPSRAKKLKQAIAKLTDKPITDIILSHEHYDHVGGTEVFPDADIHCHVNCVDVFALDPINATPKKELQTYNDEKTIDLGQQIIELHYYGPSDGVANTVIYLPQQKVVFTADLYVGTKWFAPEFVRLDSQNILGVRAVLKKVLEWDVNYSMDAHSTLTDAMELTRYAAMLEDLYKVSLDNIEKNMPRDGDQIDYVLSIDGFSRSVDLPQYKDWDNYNALHNYVTRMIMSIRHGG